MGYLHEGHLSLVRRSLRDNDVTVVSIFVNPLQFGPGEDLKRYPRDRVRDERLLKEAGVDLLLYPAIRTMYPAGYATYVEVERITEGLCGSLRPGHFRGVATVVAKLFNIVAPDRAYFGQKDAQQVAVVKAMVRDLNMDVSITVMPIIREPDGLAMSSRNRYLTVRERRDAALLSAALRKARMTFDAGERSSAKLLRVIKAIIERSDLARIEYLEIVEVPTLRPVARVRGQALIAVAVRIGSTRLIDNAILTAR